LWVAPAYAACKLDSAVTHLISELKNASPHSEGKYRFSLFDLKLNFTRIAFRTKVLINRAIYGLETRQYHSAAESSSGWFVGWWPATFHPLKSANVSGREP
jgi:hypothetical protein